MCNYAGHGPIGGHGCGPRWGSCCRGHHHGSFHRRFFTTAEKKSRLEEYLKELQAEVKAVEEKLKELGEGA
ncbi:hypothetical protein SEF58_07755 [Neomoorella humiferrea]|uniref:DUF5320 domain-containing protein n=1 Tax=Neomoorella humiferrea TaxID=676965 RepID=A0A2T0ARW1_9FIRM|nr:DUF5320 domain-containing protein [Moorella humiferrea]PRR72581.1 hypothetical protein MOHU_15100 [Moorella humiferrea]